MTIDPAALTISSADVSKVYDGTTTALGTTVDFLIGTPINSEADLAPEDKVFFRRYVALDPKTKAKLQKTLDLWDDE